MLSSCVRLSVCMSVCMSVTRRYCIKPAKLRITQTTPHDSPRTLVFWHQKNRQNSKLPKWCFVVARFLLTKASHSPSAIAELRVFTHVCLYAIWGMYNVRSTMSRVGVTTDATLLVATHSYRPASTLSSRASVRFPASCSVLLMDGNAPSL